MKKLMIASAIAMTMAAGSAMAQQGDVQFFGNVSSVTCDVTPEVGGNVTNLVQLGTVAASGTGEEVPFVLKASNPAGGQCASLNGKTATIVWDSPALTAQGLGATGGLAKDAYVILKPSNGNESDPITKSDATTTFDAAKATTDGFGFTAQLKAGSTEGDFSSAAAFAVTYK
ncbi:fimbrial protein [Plesiomonas shigelloides]|uniref:fimbrial protein n=1 Tax=Plesiomonas shigelloides TaxID=703 RepID=UPI00126278C8|nr:fimbrial protein [Plesiomonas shigelloides]KAB7714796.1 fimbrial protein [Plesiomonas shigelloides]